MKGDRGQLKLEWIDDLVAIAEARSLTDAAARRHVTQPAFSRRVRAIESHLGMTLLDRSHRPARALPAVIAQASRFRDLARTLRQIPQSLADTTRLVIACQHAPSVVLVPGLAERLLAALPDSTVRLRTGNRDDCLALLLTRGADVMIAYETAELPLAPGERFVERHELASESLLPVAAPGSAAAAWRDADIGALPIVAYPEDVFLGELMNRMVLPRLPAGSRVRPVMETALTLAARELARSGLGVAWIPESLVGDDLARGRLIDCSDRLPSCPMSLIALRLHGSKTEIEQYVWRTTLDVVGARAGGRSRGSVPADVLRLDDAARPPTPT